MTSTLAENEVQAVGAAPEPRRRAWTLLSTPAVVVAAAIGLAVYLSRTELDDSMRASINPTTITREVWAHLQLTFVSTVIVLALAIPLGIMLSRKGSHVATPIVLGLANIGQGAPAIGVIALLAVWLGIGFWVAVIALVIYSVLPALRNTLVGLEQVDQSLVDAGRGIGMSAAAVLFRIELPLAVPVILAGIRTTLVLNVGVAALAAFINGGGLGGLIVTGVKLYQLPVLITGSVLIAILALLVDWIASIAERYLHPKGM